MSGIDWARGVAEGLAGDLAPRRSTAGVLRTRYSQGESSWGLVGEHARGMRNPLELLHGAARCGEERAAVEAARRSRARRRACWCAVLGTGTGAQGLVRVRVQ